MSTATPSYLVDPQNNNQVWYPQNRKQDVIDLTIFSGSGIAANNGLVPAPVAGSNDRYLKCDGTWGTVGVQTMSLHVDPYVSFNLSGSVFHLYPGSGVQLEQYSQSAGGPAVGVKINAPSLGPATTSSFGGVKLSGSNSITAGTLTDYSTIPGYYEIVPLQALWDHTGYVALPGLARTLGPNPGLLKVAADFNPPTGFVNSQSAVAIPVFYGSIGDLETYSKSTSGDHYTIDEYNPGGSWTGHYVNVRDIVNGIIKDDTLAGILAEGLWNKLFKQ